MDWLRKNVILSIIGAVVSVSLILGGWFAQRLVNESDAKPSIEEVSLMIKKELVPVIKDQNEHNTRLVKLENAVMTIGSINNKLDNIVKQQGSMCIDIAVIKTKIDQ